MPIKKLGKENKIVDSELTKILVDVGLDKTYPRLSYFVRFWRDQRLM